MARKRDHTPDQIEAVLREINDQSDRGAAIVSAAVLEEILEITLQKRMVDLNREKYDSIFRVDGPAGSLRNKIDLFYALGLCNESHHKVLHQIREIRNKFAHRIESLTFDDETIGPLIDKLGPEKLTHKSRRLRFTNTIGTIMMLMYAVSTADIKLRGLGETHPRIYIELLKMTLPGSADDIENIWQEHMGDQ